MTAKKPPRSACACGCGKPVNPNARHAKFSAECGELRRIESKRRSNAKRDRRKSGARHYVLKSLANHARQVTECWEAVKNRRQAICRACNGMPWT